MSKEININFKELVDYIRDKDFEIGKLTYNNRCLKEEVNELREKERLISNYLNEIGITLVLEKNKVYALDKVKE